MRGWWGSFTGIRVSGKTLHGKPNTERRREMTATVTLHLGDCAEVMKTFADGCIDLTVTSPPYDNLRAYRGYVFDFEKIAQQLFRSI